MRENRISNNKILNSKIRLIALDMDHTTLKKADVISEGNRMALEDAIAEGIEIVVASGRTFSSLPTQVLDIPGIRYAITSNGAAVYEMHGETAEEKMHNAVCIQKNVLPSDKVMEILRVADEFLRDEMHVAYEVFIDGQAYTHRTYLENPTGYGVSEAYREYIRESRIPVDDMRSFVIEHSDELFGFDLQTGDSELAEKIRMRIEQEINGVYMTSSVPNRIELASENAGKESGMRFICDQLGIAYADTAAFGDARNDIGMLTLAGVGIAVANADRECKDAADYITKAYRKDGVAYGIHHYLGVPDRVAEAKIAEEQRRQDAYHGSFMREALKEAEKALELEEVPIGCVIVKDGEIIARGYNRRNTDHNTLSHAELNAIHEASRVLGDWRLEGCTMYVTLEPCQMCAGALVQSRIDEVVIGSMNPKAGCAGSVLNLMQVPQFNHQVKITKGILQEECSEMLTNFFAGLRSEKAE